MLTTSTVREALLGDDAVDVGCVGVEHDVRRVAGLDRLARLPLLEAHADLLQLRLDLVQRLGGQQRLVGLSSVKMRSRLIGAASSSPARS
jgi:hypothetical protein